jgi:hypothetical protein
MNWDTDSIRSFPFRFASFGRDERNILLKIVFCYYNRLEALAFMAHDTMSLSICFLTFWDSVVFHSQGSTAQGKTAAVFWNTGNLIHPCPLPSRTDTSSTMLQKLKNLNKLFPKMYATLRLSASFIFLNLQFTWQKWTPECEFIHRHNLANNNGEAKLTMGVRIQIKESS